MTTQPIFKTIFNAIEAEWAKAYSFDFVRPEARKMSAKLFARIRAHIEEKIAPYEDVIEELIRAAKDTMASCPNDDIANIRGLRKLKIALAKLEELE
jgi:hypothetical protein